VLPFWATALLGFLIVARVTRFLNSDYLAKDFRAWIAGRFGEGKLYYLITCPWCASIYIALPVAAVVTGICTDRGMLDWPFSAVAFLGLWLGYSWVYGLVASNWDDE
jgi:hypothetical protein